MIDPRHLELLTCSGVVSFRLSQVVNFRLTLPKRLIKSFESLRLTAYRDVGGVWTIGWGHTATARMGLTITEDEAERLLDLDTADAVAAVNAFVKRKLTQEQFDALVSFVFNLGREAFRTSSLLAEVNDGDDHYVPKELTRWVHAGGKPLKGLARRRVEEARLYLEG
jgi:lysozyme